MNKSSVLCVRSSPKKFKILSNKRIYIKIIIQHQQNVNIIYPIQVLGDDFQLDDMLKHVIFLLLKR